MSDEHISEIVKIAIAILLLAALLGLVITLAINAKSNTSTNVSNLKIGISSAEASRFQKYDDGYFIGSQVRAAQDELLKQGIDFAVLPKEGNTIFVTFRNLDFCLMYRSEYWGKYTEQELKDNGYEGLSRDTYRYYWPAASGMYNYNRDLSGRVDTTSKSSLAYINPNARYYSAWVIGDDGKLHGVLFYPEVQRP